MPDRTAFGFRWWQGAALIGFFACIFGVIAPTYVARYRIPLPSAAGIYGCFLLMVILIVIPGLRDIRPFIEERMLTRRNAVVLLLVWCLPYLAYAAGTHDFRWAALARILAIATPLLLIYGLFPVRKLEQFTWQDFAVAVWLITALLSHQLAGIWNVPANLDFMTRLFLIYVAAWCWVFVRKVPELGYEFAFTAKTFRSAGINFVLFALIAVPSSLALHFTGWNPHWHGLSTFCINYLEIFLFVALLEELFFRGFLQTLLSVNLQSPWKGQALISCLFGLFHILHAPFPNWRYVLLATVAGWFYGSAFVKGGNLMASVLTHAMVDTVWRTFFLRA
jgi:hypothetical protein